MVFGSYPTDFKVKKKKTDTKCTVVFEKHELFWI